MAYAPPSGSLPGASGHDDHLAQPHDRFAGHTIVSKKSQVELKKCWICSPMLLIQCDLSLPSSILFQFFGGRADPLAGQWRAYF